MKEKIMKIDHSVYRLEKCIKEQNLHTVIEDFLLDEIDFLKENIRLLEIQIDESNKVLE